jgi:hypothetical protein
MLATLIIEGVAIVFLGMLVVGLLRSHAEILRTLHEMGEGIDADPAPRPRPASPRPLGDDRPAGGPAHDLSGRTLDGEAVEIGLVGAATDTLLAFLSATCYTCEPFWRALSTTAEVPNHARVIAVVQDGDAKPRLRKLAGSDLLVVMSDAAWTAYDVPGSPHFVYLDGPSGRVAGEGTAATWAQVRDLLEQATSGAAQRSAAPPASERGGRDNPARIDLELLAAGIGHGHPSLYPDLEHHVDPPATA